MRGPNRWCTTAGFGGLPLPESPSNPIAAHAIREGGRVSVSSSLVLLPVSEFVLLPIQIAVGALDCRRPCTETLIPVALTPRFWRRTQLNGDDAQSFGVRLADPALTCQLALTVRQQSFTHR